MTLVDSFTTMAGLPFLCFVIRKSTFLNLFLFLSHIGGVDKGVSGEFFFPSFFFMH
jgi:hypothetical protein